MTTDFFIITIFAIFTGFIGIFSFADPVKLLRLYMTWPRWLSEHTTLYDRTEAKDYLNVLYYEPDEVKEKYPIPILAVQAGGFVGLIISTVLFCKLFGIY